MNWLDNFNLILHIDTETTQEINSSNILSSLEFTSQLNSAASAYDAAPFSNSLSFGVDYDPHILRVSKGQKVELYYKENKQGVFYIKDIAPPAEDGAIATVTAYDLFYDLINFDIVPNFEVLDGITIKQYIKQVFQSVGIEGEKIIISDDLAENTLNYSICDGKTLAAILKEFCLATDTFIYADSEENIRVIPKEIVVADEEYLTLNDDVLYGLDLGVSFDEVQTGLKLNYNRLTVGEVEEILKTELTLQPNTKTELLNLALKAPLYQISSIQTNCPSTIENVNASQNLLSIHLTSEFAEEVIAQIVVYGRLIKFVESFLEKQKDSSNPNIQSITTQLIQDTASAQILLSLLFERISRKTMTAYMMPDDFSIKLCNIFIISSNQKNLEPIYAYLHGFKFSVVEGEVDLTMTLNEIKGVEVNE